MAPIILNHDTRRRWVVSRTDRFIPVKQHTVRSEYEAEWTPKVYPVDAADYSSKTSVSAYKTARCQNSEEHSLNYRAHKLKVLCVSLCVWISFVE
jgi:hypothetical protein